MANLLEQFKGHVISQTLSNKLGEIETYLSEYDLDEQEMESLLAYQWKVYYVILMPILLSIKI